MYHSIDLNSLCDIINFDLREAGRYLKINGSELKEHEMVDLVNLVQCVHRSTAERNLLREFFVSYKIPQIGKEFDLLKFSDDIVVCVELKHGNKTLEDCKKQLIQDKNYLSALKKELLLYTFVADTKKIYKLIVDTDEYIEKTVQEFVADISTCDSTIVENPDTLFDPTVYLISPFNDTENFMNDKYFLTEEQNNFCNQYLKNKRKYSLIGGKPGTGKTLLLYDIVKKLRERGRVLIVHCAMLNNGQYELINKYNWNIISVSSIKDMNVTELQKLFEKYDYIAFDEVQRLWLRIFESVKETTDKCNSSFIFCGDPRQVLTKSEQINALFDRLTVWIDKEYQVILSKKIRTNNLVANFIKGVLNPNDLKSKDLDISKTFFRYFSSLEGAKKYAIELQHDGWKILKCTPSRYDPEYFDNYASWQGENAHNVIGQEYDKIVVPIDETFFYDQNNKLDYKNTYYHATKMLFELFTRARKQICLIIINNKEVLVNCIGMFEWAYCSSNGNQQSTSKHKKVKVKDQTEAKKTSKQI